jgi:hypothetical protein
MIKIGFNLLLFVVLLIIFIGYCWSIKIERDYNAKMEKFTNIFDAPDEPADINENSPGLSTPEAESLKSYLYNRNKENNIKNNQKSCINNYELDPSNIPSVASLNNNKWKNNNSKIHSYPGSEMLETYIPDSNISNLLMGGNEELVSISNNDIYNPNKSPLNASGDKIIAYNDDLLYINTGKNPWEHHPVQTSIPNDTKVKFKNAYYYEFDNITYLQNLKIALIVPCELLADAVLTSNWSSNIDPSSTINDKITYEATNGYTNCLQYIDNKINKSKSMILPSDIKLQARSKIQIVHDIFKSYKVHKTSNSMYLINIELILYRQAKYNGKHIDITCTAKKNDSKWIIHIVAVRILGVVSEENIGLFPVIPIDPLSVSQLPINADISTVKSIVDSPEKKAYIQSLIDKHDSQYHMIAATDKKIAKLLEGVKKYNEVQ